MGDNERSLADAPIQNTNKIPSASKKVVSGKLSLLDLPLEIRLAIYAFIFSDAVIKIRSSERRGKGKQDAQKSYSRQHYLRKDMWRPRSSIMGSCQQVRHEILSFKAYELELVLAVDDTYRLENKLPHFLFSHITKITVNAPLWRALDNIICKWSKPPSLQYLCVNQSICYGPAKEDTRHSFSDVGLWRYKCSKTIEQMPAIKAGLEDNQIMREMLQEQTCKSNAVEESFWEPENWFEPRSAGEQYSRCFRIRVFILPSSWDDRKGFVASEVGNNPYRQFPQLVLLGTWDAERRGTITERHWRENGEDATSWDCLSADEENCSCSSKSFSTSVDSKPYHGVGMLMLPAGMTYKAFG